MAVTFTDQNFEKEAMEASKNKPVLVDFFASWCGPCKLQGPIIDQLAEEMGDKAVIGKANVDEAIKISEQFSVMSVPTLIMFKDGKAVETFNGLQSKDALIVGIKKYL